MGLAKISQAIEDIKQGRFVIIVDDEDRENEGDLALAAEKVSAQAINFMAKHGRGLICLPATGERLDELQLPLMVDENTCKFGTAFTVSVDAKQGTTTGISAADRARPPNPTIWSGRGMSSRCGPEKAAFWCGPGRPRP